MVIVSLNWRVPRDVRLGNLAVKETVIDGKNGG
jgi:hypothetical protein